MEKHIIVPLSVGFLLGFMLGVGVGLNKDLEYKKPIKPVIQIEDKDGKSDTTYIYRF